MANDVFGRPMNDQPTSFPVNRRPLAPNPLAPEPQDEPFSGIRGPGDLGTERASTPEFLGAQYGINVQRFPRQQEDHSLDWAGSPGGHPVRPAVPHNPMPSGVAFGVQRQAEE